MARLILVYGQPAAGKTFALKTLDPKSTVIIDGDRKGALPWRGWAKDYSTENKNFFSVSSIDKTLELIEKIATADEFKNVSVLVIDGFNNILSNEETAYANGWRRQYKNKLELFDGIANKAAWLVEVASGYRKSLTVVFNAHVKTADPYVAGDRDRLFTPGKALEQKKKIEGKFLFSFYAKADDEGNHFFETAPHGSTARSSEGCFEFQIPNDMKFVIDTINAYDKGETK